MTFILLTGAGFSRNWGGWLSAGSPEIDDNLRSLLWPSKEPGGGFEDALAELQEEHERRRDAHSEIRQTGSDPSVMTAPPAAHRHRSTVVPRWFLLGNAES